MRTITATAIGVCLLVLAVAADAHGQMFGPRQLGQSLSRRPSPGGSQEPGRGGDFAGQRTLSARIVASTDFVGPGCAGVAAVRGQPAGPRAGRRAVDHARAYQARGSLRIAESTAAADAARDGVLSPPGYQS